LAKEIKRVTTCGCNRPRRPKAKWLQSC